jgi:4-amino-4-deoxy-L-arabinose transferase-like glycosyltransferase
LSRSEIDRFALNRRWTLTRGRRRTAADPAPNSASTVVVAHGPLILLLAARLALGLAYSQAVPAWESYDEDGHFAYARYLAEHHSLILPPNDPEAAQIWEKFQPPLYYDLIAPIIGFFDLGPSFGGLARNPYFTNGDAGVNYTLHTTQKSPAERSIERALATGRAAGVVISTLSVLPIFWLARQLWPREPGTRWLAVVAYAFWPQFLFVGSMLTNDVLITALSALALWLAVDLALNGFRPWVALALGAVVGLALLTKLNGAAAIVLAVGALALSLAPARKAANPAGRRWLFAGIASLVLLVAGAIWALSSLNFVTNQVFQLSVARDFAVNIGSGGQRNGGLIAAALAYAFRTFLASYGWGNLESYPWIYRLWTLGALLAAAGAVLASGRGLRRRRGLNAREPPARIYWLLAAFTTTVVGLALALAIAQQNVYLVPGRYLLPALPAVCLLLVAGWRSWLPARQLRRRAWQALGLGVILAGWLVPFGILAPAYAQPKQAAVVTVETPIGVVYGDSLELLGYDGAVRATAGQSARATLCWGAVAPMAANHTLFLEVVGADGQGYGRLRTFPGHGNYPTSQWALNTEFCEPYEVPIAVGIPAPALAHLRVSWLVGTTNQPLPMRLSSGATQADSAYLLEFKVSGQPGYVPPIAHLADYRLGEQIRLTGFDVTQNGRQVRVTLRWEALQDVMGNYEVFAHLRDTPNHAYAQGDGLPVQGAYPTPLWKKGEVILDTHVMTLPAGHTTPPLALYVGMTDAQAQRRLPVFGASGHELSSDEIILAQGLVFP